MAACLNRFDHTEAVAVSTDSGAVAAAGVNAVVFRDERFLAAAWGQVQFSDPGLSALCGQRGVAAALAQGYACRGPDVLSVTSGAFALAVLDCRDNDLMLAVDRLGVRPLHYSVVGDTLVFGTSLDAVSAFPGCSTELDLQAVYDYVYFHMVPGPGTIFSGRYRLLPGSLLTWRGGRPDVRRYWHVRYVEDLRRPTAELRRDFLTRLREGVSRASQGGRIGTFLSGGTDSSTVAGLLGEVTGSPARTYSIGFEAQGYDEMEYARLAARHFGTRHHEYYVTPDDVVRAVPRIAEVFDQPFGNSSAVPTYYCARMARDDGVDILLGGDGGDELFGGNERYAKQYLYALYGDLPRLVRKVLIEPAVFLLPEVGIAGKVQRYIRNASLPMPARYDNYNLLERLGATNIFTPEFLDSIDGAHPKRMLDDAYAEAEARSLINRMLSLDMRFTLADNDLPKVTRASELAGVAVRFPFLDDAIVSFSLGLPPRDKLRGTRLRYFFKESLRGFLPRPIIDKTKHGFGLPFGPWLRTHAALRDLALDSLSDLKKRRFVQPSFIDNLTSTYVDSHAGYYGTLVWVLMLLEQWLSRHARGP